MNIPSYVDISMSFGVVCADRSKEEERGKDDERYSSRYRYGAQRMSDAGV